MINGFFVKFVDVVSQSTDFIHRMSYWFTEVHRQVVAFKIKALHLYFVYLLQCESHCRYTVFGLSETLKGFRVPRLKHI